MGTSGKKEREQEKGERKGKEETDRGSYAGPGIRSFLIRVQSPPDSGVAPLPPDQTLETKEGGREGGRAGEREKVVNYIDLVRCRAVKTSDFRTKSSYSHHLVLHHLTCSLYTHAQ